MPRFVVQEHHATRLHWDFRLEMDGVLKSWAVPKGPPTEPGVKRLAVQVDDHPLDYIDFQGVIEEGYGAGTVDIWDAGTYEWESQEEKLYKIVMAGSRLKGRFKMVFTGYGGGKGWLLIKSRDETGEEVSAKERSADAPDRKGRKKATKKKVALKTAAKKVTKKPAGG
jgi:bifunctional non-homologous end joining protein LigD